MRTRIDEFIKVAKHRDLGGNIHRLYNELSNLLDGDDLLYLRSQFVAMEREQAIAIWDEKFLQETINPTPPESNKGLAQAQTGKSSGILQNYMSSIRRADEIALEIKKATVAYPNIASHIDTISGTN